MRRNRLAVIGLLFALGAQAQPADTVLDVTPLSGRIATVDAAALARLPATHVAVDFQGEHGKTVAAFDGPLLWTVLNEAGALAGGTTRDQVHEAVRVVGADGYVAILALGEIAPGFENKPVILADRQDGKALPPGHLRLVVPQDQRGGRRVRDVRHITIIAP